MSFADTLQKNLQLANVIKPTATKSPTMLRPNFVGPAAPGQEVMAPAPTPPDPTKKPGPMVFKVGENLTKPQTAKAQQVIDTPSGVKPDIFHQVADMPKQAIQGATRAVAEVGLSGAQAVLPKTVSDKTLTIQPKNKIERAVFGDEPLKPLATQVAETEQTLKPKLGKYALPTAFAGTVLGTAGNLYPGVGGEEEKITQELADQLITHLGEEEANKIIATGSKKAAEDALSKVTERGLTTSLKEAPTIAPEVKPLLKGKYTPITNEKTFSDAATLVAKDAKAAEQLVGQQTAEGTATGFQLIKKYQSEGNWTKAAEIANRMSPSLTTAGQAIQAASRIDQLSPEGILSFAKKMMSDAGTQAPEDFAGKQVSKIIGKADISPTLARDLTLKAQELAKLDPLSKEATQVRNDILTRIAKEVPSGKLDQALTIWKAGLVTAPVTHVAKTVSELTNMGIANVDSATATLLDKMISAVGSLTDRWGMTEDLSRRTQGFSFGSLFEQWQGIKDGVGGGISTLKSGQSDSFFQTLDQVYRGLNLPREINYGGPLGGLLNVYTKAPFRLLSGEADIFKNAGLQAALYEQARVLALNEGLVGDALKSRIADIISNPPADVAINALNEAESRIFYNKGAMNNIISGIKQRASQTPGLKGKLLRGVTEFVIPFQRVPSNIATSIFEHSPAGVLETIINQLDPITRGRGTFLKDISKNITGTGIMILGYLAAKKGIMTGAAPVTGTKASTQFYTEGKQPNAIKIGNKYYSLNRASIIGNLMGLGADFANSLDQGSNLISAAGQAGFGGVQSVLNQPFLTGPERILSATQNPQRYGTQAIQSTVGSIVPRIVADAAKIWDPAIKNPQGILETLKSEIPGLSKSVPSKRDPFGNISVSGAGKLAGIDPFKTSTANQDPILMEADNLGVAINTPTQTISGVKMTPAEYDKFQQFSGKALHTALTQLISSDDYKNADSATKQTLFNDTITQIHTAANSTLFPVLMIKRYGLPSDTDPATLREVLTQLNKQSKWKKMSLQEQTRRLQKVFGNK